MSTFISTYIKTTPFDNRIDNSVTNFCHIAIFLGIGYGKGAKVLEMSKKCENHIEKTGRGLYNIFVYLN